MPRGLCPGDVSGLDFEIRRTNTATGESGTAPFAIVCVSYIIAGETVPGIQTWFEVGPISLVMGSNRIELNTFEGAQQIGRDVVTLIREDMTAPKVSGTFPRPFETAVPTNRKLLVRFNEAMLESSLTSDRFELSATGGDAVDVQASYDDATRSWLLQPDTTLAASTEYTAVVKSAVQDANGNALVGDFSWIFTTGAGEDLSSPSVAAFRPGSDCHCAPTSTRILVNLNEALAPASADSLRLGSLRRAQP